MLRIARCSGKTEAAPRWTILAQINVSWHSAFSLARAHAHTRVSVLICDHTYGIVDGFGEQG